MTVQATPKPIVVSAQSQGRRILFIGIPYYSYTESIAQALASKGFIVDYFPTERRTFWSKCIKKLFPRMYKSALRSYHDHILATASGHQYDYVFFLQIHSLDIDHVKSLKRTQPTAKFILYNWDSLTTHDYRSYIGYLDATYTFDRDDATALNVHYLPLFALPQYFGNAQKARHSEDIYFVGSIGTLERFMALRRFAQYCRSEDIRFARHLHCSPAVFLMLLRRGLYIRGMSIRALSTGKIVKLMNKSLAVFDFPNRPQSGYTMRLIENMCAGKKIVTANSRVRSEPFYSEDQFFVVDNLRFVGLKGFLEPEFQAAKSENATKVQYSEFTLDSWINTIFS